MLSYVQRFLTGSVPAKLLVAGMRLQFSTLPCLQTRVCAYERRSRARALCSALFSALGWKFREALVPKFQSLPFFYWAVGGGDGPKWGEASSSNFVNSVDVLVSPKLPLSFHFLNMYASMSMKKEERSTKFLQLLKKSTCAW